MQSPDGHETSLSQQPSTYRNFFSMAYSSFRSTGQSIARKAAEAQRSSQEKMGDRPNRKALSPLHDRLRELALEEVFKETKDLLHKIIDRVEAREIPILFACIKEMSETDIDSLQQFLFDIIQSLNPDSIEEDLRNISTHLWAKTHTSFQLKKPSTRRALIIPETLKAKFTKLGDSKLIIQKEHGHTLELTCPISLEIMSDPVKLKVSGKIFDRQSILRWFDICESDPYPVTPHCPLSKKVVTERPFEEALTFDEDTQHIIEGTLALGRDYGYKILETNDKVNVERFQRIGKFNDLTVRTIEQLNTKIKEGTIDQQVICPITNKIITRPVRFKDSSIIFDASSIDDLIAQSLSKETDLLQVDIDGTLIYESPEGLSIEESFKEFIDGIQTDTQSLIMIGMKVQKLVKNFIAENRFRQTQTLTSSLQRTTRQLRNMGASAAGLFANQLSTLENRSTQIASPPQGHSNLGHTNQPPASLSEPIIEPIDEFTRRQIDQDDNSDQYSYDSNSDNTDIEADNSHPSYN